MDASKAYNKRRLIIVGFIFVLFIVVPLVIFILNSSSFSNRFGASTPVAGLGSIKNISQEFRDSIEASLHNTLNLNGVSDKVSGAVVRDGSASQSEARKGVQYNGKFIIDLESVRQSYLIEYYYSANKDDGYSGGYPVIVRCPDADLLIYGAFDCKDIVSVENTGVDPILNTLPYLALNYEVLGVEDESGVVSLKIKLILSEIDYRTGKDAAVLKYKNEALKQIRTMGYNPEDYIIEYSY